MERRYYIVDVFTNERLTGNPAAVVLDCRDLSDATMQAIAAEFNLSETTFMLPPPSRGPQSSRTPLTYPLRWFTPRAEVAMCGHATIAGVHALIESGELSPKPSEDFPTLRIETCSGPLTALVESLPGQEGRRLIWLELRPPKLSIHGIDKAQLAVALRMSPDGFDSTLPAMRTQDMDLIVMVKDMVTLHDVDPDFAALGGWLSREGLRGLSLATVNTVTPSISLQSRFFAPPVGIDEDPVTGSVHGPLAAYLLMHNLIPLHDGVAGFMAVQGKPGGRTGLVRGLVEPQGDESYSVRIAGEAVTTMRGTLIV